MVNNSKWHAMNGQTFASGLIKYFASDNFKGIGKKTAERIVEIYGEDPPDKILEDPSKLEQRFLTFKGKPRSLLLQG